MKIVVIGTGYVGLTTAACLSSLGHSVVGVDIDEEKIKALKHGRVSIHEPGLHGLVNMGLAAKNLGFATELTESLNDAEVCFITVGTPALLSGKVDMRYVDAVAKSIGECSVADLVVVNKSTVPVGTAKRVKEIILSSRGVGARTRSSLGKIAASPHRNTAARNNEGISVVSNPEFLREGSAVKDFLRPDRIVIGTDDERAREIMSQLYKDFDCPKLVMSPESAEFTKYAANGFLATKISFINEVANICDRIGADVRDVAKGIGLDKRIGSHFLNAGIGYGGSCFPKDTSALHQIAGQCNYDFQILSAVIDANNRARTQFVERVVGELPCSRTSSGDQVHPEPPLQNVRLAVWGLSFKANTDDIRESAAIDIVEQLLELGASIMAYDPAAQENAKQKLGDKITYAGSELDAAFGADALLILTEWPEFKEVDPLALKSAMSGTHIFDGRNLLADKDYASHGFKYTGVGLGASLY